MGKASDMCAPNQQDVYLEPEWALHIRASMRNPARFLMVKLDYLNLALLSLSVLGLFISAYVTESFWQEVPAICVGGGCDLIRTHPASRIFGVPVPVFGFVGYFFLAIMSLFRVVRRDNSFKKIIFGIALAGAGFESWFTYVQLAVIGGVCIWCLLSGLCMYLLLLISTVTLSSRALS